METESQKFNNPPAGRGAHCKTVNNYQWSGGGGGITVTRHRY